jgi:hypothetical protein
VVLYDFRRDNVKDLSNNGWLMSNGW